MQTSENQKDDSNHPDHNQEPKEDRGHPPCIRRFQTMIAQLSINSSSNSQVKLSWLALYSKVGWLIDCHIFYFPLLDSFFALLYKTKVVMLCYVMFCYFMLSYVMLCYVMFCYVMLLYVMLCYVMLCYVMLCYVMLCYVMLCYVWTQLS